MYFQGRHQRFRRRLFWAKVDQDLARGRWWFRRLTSSKRIEKVLILIRIGSSVLAVGRDELEFDLGESRIQFQRHRGKYHVRHGQRLIPLYWTTCYVRHPMMGI